MCPRPCWGVSGPTLELFLRSLCNTQGGILTPSQKGGGVFHLSGPVPQVSLPWGPGSEWQGCGWSFLTVCVPCRHQLEMPGHYSHLAAFYEDKKGVLHAGPGRGGSLPPVYWLPSIHRYMYPEMKVGPPGSHTVPDVGLEQQL